MTGDVLLPVALAYLMLVVGLETPPRAFAVLLATPRAVLVGFVAQTAVLPALAFGIAYGLRLPPEAALGLVIVAAAPGGVTAGFATTLLRGDAALSICLTALTSLAALVSVPTVVGLAIAGFGAGAGQAELPVAATLAALALTTVFPVATAQLVQRLWPAGCRRWLPMARRLGTVVFLLIIGGAVLAQWRAILAEGGRVLVAVLLLNVLAMAAGWGLARVAGLAGARRRAIAIECGLQNVALALLVAGPILGRPELGGPATVYAFLMNITLLCLLAPAGLRRLRMAAPNR